MLEIKSYEDWSTEDKEQDKVEKLKNYTDYVRSSYFKSGTLDQKVEDEIQFGAAERLKMDGVVSSETPKEEADALFKRVVGTKQNQDSDARFVLDHLRNSSDDLDPTDVSLKTATLSKYLDTKSVAPERAVEMNDAVNDILKDRELVKQARISAVDRGDFDVVAVDTDKGRQLYSSPYAKPETVTGSIDALIKNGAVSTADLVGVKDIVGTINGGLSTKAKLSSYAMFEQAAERFIKGDADANEVVIDRATSLTEQKRKEQLTTGETTFEAVKTVVSKPFDWLGEKILETGTAIKEAATGEKAKEPTPNKYGEGATLYDVLNQNKAFTDKFSPEILQEFSNNFEIRKSMPSFRADRPETGIITDTLGNPIIAPALLPKKELFEQAINSSTLNDDQKASARLERDRNLQAVAPSLKTMILSEEPDAVSEYAKARAQGLSDAQFVESWVANDENYNGFTTRLEQLGKGFIKSIVELPLGLAALAGNESAAKAMGAMQKDQADRQEYSRLFGDEYGLGFQLINTLPQVGTDIAATIGTGALGTALKTGVKASAKNIFRTAAKGVVSELDDVAVAAGKNTLEAGGEAALGSTLKTMGDSVATKLGQATELAPLLAVSFTRSAGSTYGSIYNQLPDTMSHEEKHKQSFGYAIASGISTAAITGGMSFLGRGAVEDIATNRLRAMAAGETDDAVRAAGNRPIPLDELNYKQAKTLWQNINNEGRAIVDKEFQDALSSAVGSSYKNFIRTSVRGFRDEAFEEALDQAIQIKLEDAATDRDTPLVERINQIWTAGILGGSLGGTTSTIGQLTPVNKSDVTIALEARASGLKDIADRLSKAGSPSTMEIVQRRMDDANAALARQTQLDIKNSEDAQARGKTTETANPYDKPLKFDEVGQAELPLGIEPAAPKKTQFLADVVGSRATVGGYTGSVELSEEGGVRLALDDVRDDGVTHINIGPKLMPVNKSGLSVDRNTLTALGTDSGTIKAGTPFVVPDKKAKSQFAFPEAAENVVVLPSLGGVDAILVRNTRMVGQENVTRDVVITDPDQIEDTIKYYKLDPKMVTEQKDVGQLELDLFGEPAPAPVAEAPASEQLELPLTEVQPPVAVQEQPVQKRVSPEIETAREMVVGNPLVAELRLLVANGFKPEDINKVATQFTPEQFIDLETRLSTASKFAMGLGDTKTKDRTAILNSVESLTAINERVKVARIIPASAPQVVEAAPEVVNTTTATVEPTIAASVPVAPQAELPKQKKTKGKRRAVTPIEGTTVVDNPEDPTKQVVELEVKKDSLAETTMIPDFYKSAPPISLVEAEKKVAETMSKIAADRQAGISIPSFLISAVQIMATRVNKAKGDIQIESNNIDTQIAEIEKPDEPVKTDADAIRDNLMSIITGEQQAPEAATKKAKSIVVPTKPFENESGVFRNETEAQLFSDFVNNGYLVSNLTEFGFHSKKVSGISLGYKRAEGLPAYQVEIKQRILAGIKDRFPFIEAPETDIVTVKSKVPFGNMEDTGSEYLPLPMVADSEQKPIRGFFTNDPRVTAAQMDLGKEVYASKETLQQIKNGEFNLNPSIEVDEDTGRVKRVELYPNHSGVYGAGDLSLVGTSGYESRGENKPMQLDSLLVEPAARYLDNAGPTARNRSSGMSTYQSFMDDAIAASNLYEDVPLEESQGASKTRRSRIGNLLLNTFKLDENNAEHVVLSAQMDHSLQLKEFGLASRISSVLEAARLKDPNTTIEDLKSLPKIIVQSMKDAEGNTPSYNYAASILKANRYGGTSPEDVLTNYGLNLYGRLTNFDLSKGVTSFSSLISSRARNTVKAQKRRGTLDTAVKTISVDAATQTTYPESKPAFAAMSQLISENDDVRASVIAAEEDNLTQLVNNLESNDTMYDLLFGIVQKSVPDLNPNINSEDLVNIADRTLSSSKLEERKAISESLSNSTEGLKLANLLLEAGWLPPVGRAGRVIPPSVTAALSPQERTKALKPPTSNEAIRENVRAMKQLARTNPDIKLSISDDVTMAADAARKMNQAELDKLGVRSGDTESVVEAFRQIAETGKPQHRRVAALLVQSPELIRNVNFNIGDFNDVRFAGAFMPKSNLVVINLSGHNGRGIADVLLHEFLHAETHQIMTNPKTPMQRKALARITALRNLTKVEAGKRGLESDQFVDALGDDVEFLAYALTDVKFQGVITDATPTGQRSLLSRIVDAILNFFGVDKDANLSNPLEELIDFARMFATDTTYNINYRSTIRDRADQIQDVISSFKAELQMYNRSLKPQGVSEPTIRFARKSKLTNEQLDYLADLEAELEGGEPAMLSAIVEEKQLPTTDGWLFRDGTFMEVDLATQGNAEASLVTHRESIITVIVDKHERALEDFLDEKGVESELMLDDNDIYELAKRLGYARIVSSGTELYVEATGELSSRQRATLKDASIESGMSVIRDLGPNRARQFITLFDGKLQYSPATEVDEPIERFEGVLTSVANQLADLLPANINVEFDSTLDGEAAVSRANFRTVKVNAENLYKRVANMNKRGAKASIRSLIDHELGHIAVGMEFTPDEVAKVADSLGEQRLQQIAEEYYSATGLTADEIRSRVAADRESGRLTNSDIADEWLRMTVTKVATGQTAENDIRYALKDPTLLDAVVRSIQAFITKLRQLFADYPTTETAAMVSRASRTFNKIKKGMAMPDSNVLEDTRFGDSESFLAALDGAPEIGRTMYAMPVMSSNPKKVDGLWATLKSKMYNLPAELRAISNMRTGTINTISSSLKDFIRDFPKMRDTAIASGVSVDDIKTLFGTTAPPLTDAVLKDINNKVDNFETQLDTTGLTEEQVEQRVLDYRESLKRDERLKFNTEFRKKQVAAEKAVAAAGFGGLVSKAIALRKDINKFKGDIGFDESNDVYLTRAYRYFTTEGWAMAARSGGQITVDGKVVDFERLRSAAAEAYREQAHINLSKTGRPYTEQDASDMTLDMLDKYLETLETMSKTTDRIAVDSLRKDLNRFKPKKDIDSTFRELLGEIDDPVANAANTLFKVGMMSANEQFRNQFAQTAIDLGLASKQPKPDYVKWRSESSYATMGPMAGLWFDPKIAGVLDETFGVNMANHMANSTKMMSKIGRGVSRMSGLAVQMKTQLGIGYWPRNAIGGYLMGAAQGIFWNPLSDAGRESVIQAARGAFSNLPTEEKQRDAILRLVQLNVLNDQSQGRVVQDMIRGLIATPEQELQELMADIDEARATKDAGGVVARIKQKGLIKGVFDVAGSKYGSLTDFLGALDGMIDGLYKVNAYYYERGIIDRHFGKSMSEAEKDEAAALKVKLVFAGHSQVIDAVQSFNRTPLASIFLPFARWKSEVFRTMLNTIPLAMEEINQGGLMARRGTRRLAGFIGTLTAAPTIIGTLTSIVFRALSGDDEDEERMLKVNEIEALREGLPKWQRGHSLYAQVLKGNKIQFIDMTYILPHSQLTDMIKIISDGYRTGKGLEGSKLASYVVNELIGVQIAAASIGEILANQDDFGQPIYVETDSAPVKVNRMLMHYGKNALLPSASLKFYEAFRTGQQNTGDILLGEALGARPRTLTFGEVERRAFRNLKSLQDSSVRIIGELVSGRYKSQDDVDDVINRHQDAMNQTQARLSNFMRTMKSLGSPESSIGASAKASKFSDDTIQSAYAGYRIAWRPNNTWAEKAYANTKQGEEQDPNERLQMIANTINNKPDIYWVSDLIE
jgi:hypothetical protein